jgi:hypothetical protein
LSNKEGRGYGLALFLFIELKGYTMKIIRPFTVVESGLTSNVTEADAAAYSALSAYIIGDSVMSNHRTYEALLGMTRTVTFDGAGAPNINLVAHGFGLNTNTPVIFATTISLPAEITAGVIYYTRGGNADVFYVSATPGGANINFATTGAGTRSVKSGNIGKDPATNPTYWLDTGATNRWKMFDTSVQSQTVNAVTIDATVTLTDRIDTMAFLNIDAISVQVIMTDPVEGVVFNETVDTNNVEGIIDFYTYCFEPINRVTDLVINDVPPYATATVEVILVSPISGTTKCGGCVMGLGLTLGDTEMGATSGIQDYSIKQRDNFGNYTVLERAFAKRANFTVYMDSRLVDRAQNMLAFYRATPIVYIGSGSYGATVIYGFYKSFEISIGYPDGESVCTLEIEGLT